MTAHGQESRVPSRPLCRRRAEAVSPAATLGGGWSNARRSRGAAVRSMIVALPAAIAGRASGPAMRRDRETPGRDRCPHLPLGAAGVRVVAGGPRTAPLQYNGGQNHTDR